MPIPTVNENETQENFIGRCISSISGEYDQDQASAICHGEWRDKDKKLSKVDSANLKEAMSSPKLKSLIEREATLILEEVKAIEAIQLAFGDSKPGGIVWRICVYLPEGGTRDEYFEGDLKDAVSQARDLVIDYGAGAYAHIFDVNEKYRAEIRLNANGKTVTAQTADPLSYQ